MPLGRWIVGLSLLAGVLSGAASGGGRLQAAEEPALLDWLPETTGFVLLADNPSRWVEVLAPLPHFKELLAFPEVRELLDGTSVRRGLQLLRYVERDTGRSWTELLDHLAGGGAALAVTYSPAFQPDAAVILLRGRDAASVESLFRLARRLIEDDRARQGDARPLQRLTRDGAEILKIESDAFLARKDAWTIFANSPQGLDAVLKRASGQGASVLAKPQFRKALDSRPADALGWMWLDFASLKQTRDVQNFFATTRKDLIQTLLFGATADCLRRSDYVTAALTRNPAGFRFRIHLPAGRREFPPEFALHVPPAGTLAALPLLQPPGVLYSQCLYLDISTLWTQRDKLINEQVRKEIEKGEKDLSRFLPGTSLGEIFSQWGGHHRFVVLNLQERPYAVEPGQKLPGFGYVATLKDPKLGKSVEGVIRAAGFVLSLSQGLKLVEEQHQGVPILAYRFPEDRPWPEDVANIRFNFEPSFALVGNQFIVGSTREVTRKLIDALKQESTRGGEQKPSDQAPVWRSHVFASAGAEALAAAPDATITELMLRQAINLPEAREQVRQIGEFLKTLGQFALEMTIAEDRYHLDLLWQLP